MRCRWFSVLALLVAGSQVGCGVKERGTAETQKPGPVQPHARNLKIPAEVSYPVIRDEHDEYTANHHRRVAVRLNMRVSEEVLREIALEVKTAVPEQYERTFIFYYLPEEILGVSNIPWASTEFMPTLDVRILGSTIQEEQLLRRMEIQTPGKRLGSWLVEYGGAQLAIIFEDAGILKLAEVLPDNSRFDCEMEELPAESGRRFKKKPKGTEIYEVDSAGVLRMYGPEGRAFAGAFPLK